MVIFFPSIHPSLLSSCRKASMRTALPEAVLESRKPMRKIFPVCCALAKEPEARRRSVTNQRSLLTMAFTFQRNVMPQNGAYENHNFMDEDGYGNDSFLLQGE